MKRKRKVFYEVSVPNLWWCGKKLGWIKDPHGVEYHTASSSRSFKTSNRAFAHVLSSPVGSALVQVSYNKGRKRVKQYKRV